jgi:predicted small secreted protein
MKRNAFKKLVMAAAVLPAFYLSACNNTVEGAGKDIENAGEAIQENTETNQGY